MGKVDVLTFSSQISGNIAQGQLPDGTPYIEREALLFSTGVHKNRNYKASDLDSMVTSFTEPTDNLDWSVPVQLDHSDSARDSVGHLRKVFRKGDKLYGILRFVGQEACSKVESGLWKRLSISVYSNLKIREVSVTPFPFVGAAQVFEEEKEMEIKAPAALPEENHVENFAVKLAAMEAQFAERTAKQEAEIQELRAISKAQGEVIRFTELAATVESFCADGKTLPAMREAELSLLKTFSSEQLGAYKALKSTQPALIEFGVKGLVKAEKPSVGSDEETEEEMDSMIAESAKRRKGMA